jgi:predicted PhzF superfamily epimerase YddE/YHI9
VLEAVHLVNGPRWQMLRLGSVEEVLAAEPAGRAVPGSDVGLVAAYPHGAPLQLELRAFFADGLGRVKEDPVTGSFNAGVAMHLFAAGLATARYIAGQGQKVGADGRIRCTHGADGSVWIGGRSVTIARGAELPALP